VTTSGVDDRRRSPRLLPPGFGGFRVKRMLAGVVLAGLSCSAVAKEEWACWKEVEARYGISSQLLYAIAKVESGLNPAARGDNKANGGVSTGYGIGLMQIDSSWLPRLKRDFGITEAHLDDPCINLNVGAWILAGNIARMGYGWEAVGAYNAKTGWKRVRYANKVHKALISSR